MKGIEVLRQILSVQVTYSEEEEGGGWMPDTHCVCHTIKGSCWISRRTAARRMMMIVCEWGRQEIITFILDVCFIQIMIFCGANSFRRRKKGSEPPRKKELWARCVIYVAVSSSAGGTCKQN